MPIGHTGQWPNYFERKVTNRRLAILEGNNLYVENIGSIDVATLAALVDILFNQNILAFCQDITSEGLIFPESIFYDGCELLSTKDGHLIAARYGRNRESRWIIPSTTWGRNIENTFLSDMRDMYDYYKVGVKPTPGSEGRAILRRTFQQNHYGRHSACNVIASNFIIKHDFGGRCDTPHIGFVGDGIELDMASGYLAHFLILPTGTSRWFRNGHINGFATFFCECDVTIHQHLPLGPFPVRTGRKGTHIVFPCVPGTYTTHLWKEQIDDAIEAGCTVKIKHGVGWNGFTDNTSNFARYMHQNRVSHTGCPLEHFDKQIAVSTIGGFGMKNTFYRLSPDDDERFPSMLNSKNNPLNYVIEEYNDYSGVSMVHWRSYCIMQCNRSLYKYALPYAIAGRLLMTNYDAIIVIEGDETHKYAEKHTLEALMCQAGDWRWQRLTNITILGARSLKCDQKIVRPGVEREEVAA